MVILIVSSTPSGLWSELADSHRLYGDEVETVDDPLVAAKRARERAFDAVVCCVSDGGEWIGAVYSAAIHDRAIRVLVADKSRPRSEALQHVRSHSVFRLVYGCTAPDQARFCVQVAVALHQSTQQASGDRTFLPSHLRLPMAPVSPGPTHANTRMPLGEALGQALAARNAENYARAARIAEHAGHLARLCGLGESAVEAIMGGALLSEVGKLAIPDFLFLTGGLLAEDDWKLISRYAQIGSHVASACGLSASAASVVQQHRAFWNGQSSYDARKHEEIDVGARIYAVAELIDDCASHRESVGAEGIAMALAEAERGRARAFDPSIVEAFRSNSPRAWSLPAAQKALASPLSRVA